MSAGQERYQQLKFHSRGARVSGLLQWFRSEKEKNIQLKRPGDASSTPKLMPKWIGPFKVTKVVGKGAYKLGLPSTMQVHDVFHVSLIKPYHSDGRVQPAEPIVVDGELEWEVDLILAHRERKRGKGIRREYLVKWTGYGPEHNSWEPERSMSDLIAYQTYWESQGLEPPVPEK